MYLRVWFRVTYGLNLHLLSYSLSKSNGEKALRHVISNSWTQPSPLHHPDTPLSSLLLSFVAVGHSRFLYTPTDNQHLLLRSSRPQPSAVLPMPPCDCAWAASVPHDKPVGSAIRVHSRGLTSWLKMQRASSAQVPLPQVKSSSALPLLALTYCRSLP